MYTEIKNVTKTSIKAYKKILKNVVWKDVIGPEDDFKTWFYNGDIKEFPEYFRAFFIKLPAGGKLHEHIDTHRVQRSYCIPIQTTPEAVTISEKVNKHYLKVGKLYEVNRYVTHRSENNGSTDRIHLIVEV